MPILICERCNNKFDVTQDYFDSISTLHGNICQNCLTSEERKERKRQHNRIKDRRLVEITCSKCKKTYQMSYSRYRKIKNKNKHLCASCAWSDEARKAAGERSTKRYNALSDEEKILWAKKSKDIWNNRSVIERKNIGKKISIGQRRSWSKLSRVERIIRNQSSLEAAHLWHKIADPDVKNKVNEKISKANIEKWNKLTLDDYKKYCKQKVDNYNKRYDIEDIIKRMTPTEIEFRKLLLDNNIEHEIQVYNKIYNKDFNEKFVLNEDGTYNRLNAYHKWDFILNLNNTLIYVDIDGSIHDYSSLDKINPKSTKFKILSNSQAKDKLRKFQADGCMAYAVQCFNDKVTYDTTVQNILNTKNNMTLQEFFQMLNWLSI